MKVAMFEGLKRARKLRGECAKGTHATCVSNRKKQKKGLTAQQKAFKRIAKTCKGKGSLTKYRACFKPKWRAFIKTLRVKRFKR